MTNTYNCNDFNRAFKSTKLFIYSELKKLFNKYENFNSFNDDFKRFYNEKSINSHPNQKQILYDFFNVIYINSQINYDDMKTIISQRDYELCIHIFVNKNSIKLEKLPQYHQSVKPSQQIGRPPSASRRSKLGGNIKTIKVVKQY